MELPQFYLETQAFPLPLICCSFFPTALALSGRGSEIKTYLSWNFLLKGLVKGKTNKQSPLGSISGTRNLILADTKTLSLDKGPGSFSQNISSHVSAHSIPCPLVHQKNCPPFAQHWKQDTVHPFGASYNWPPAHFGDWETALHIVVVVWATNGNCPIISTSSRWPTHWPFSLLISWNIPVEWPPPTMNPSLPHTLNAKISEAFPHGWKTSTRLLLPSLSSPGPGATLSSEVRLPPALTLTDCSRENRRAVDQWGGGGWSKSIPQSFWLSRLLLRHGPLRASLWTRPETNSNPATPRISNLLSSSPFALSCCHLRTTLLV